MSAENLGGGLNIFFGRLLPDFAIKRGVFFGTGGSLGDMPRNSGKKNAYKHKYFGR